MRKSKVYSMMLQILRQSKDVFEREISEINQKQHKQFTLINREFQWKPGILNSQNKDKMQKTETVLKITKFLTYNNLFNQDA